MQVHATTPGARFEVTCGMSGLTSRARTALLSGLADALGLTDALVDGLSVHSRAVRHEPGRVARDLAVMLAGIRVARAAARAHAWGLGEAPRRLVLDIDATLLTAHSEKEGAAGTYKGGFGFHPLLCFEATSGEALAGILRPGNAGANTAADRVTLLEAALAQLPEGATGRGTLVRCDSAGATHDFLDAVVARGLSFS